MEEKDRLVGQWGLDKSSVHPRSTECYNDLQDKIRAWADTWLEVFDARDLTFAIHDVADEPRLLALEREVDPSLKNLTYPE